MTLGYIRGKSFPLAIEWCDGVWMACDCAVAWKEIRDAAAKDGVKLIPSSGWRSFEEQKALWTERSDPDVRAIKGPAAKPGYSNHQSGRAVDIRGCPGVKQLSDGHSTPVYDWLKTNAKRFGFQRTVTVEAWHWEISVPREDRITKSEQNKT